MKGNTGTIEAIMCTAIVVLMTWFFVTAMMTVYRSTYCENYSNLTKTETTLLKGKCYKYVDGQLQIVKELE